MILFLTYLPNNILNFVFYKKYSNLSSRQKDTLLSSCSSVQAETNMLEMLSIFKSHYVRLTEDWTIWHLLLILSKLKEKSFWWDKLEGNKPGTQPYQNNPATRAISKWACSSWPYQNKHAGQVISKWHPIKLDSTRCASNYCLNSWYCRKSKECLPYIILWSSILILCGFFNIDYFENKNRSWLIMVNI